MLLGFCEVGVFEPPAAAAGGGGEILGTSHVPNVAFACSQVQILRSITIASFYI